MNGKLRVDESDGVWEVSGFGRQRDDDREVEKKGAVLKVDAKGVWDRLNVSGEYLW